jgi:NTE family protein
MRIEQEITADGLTQPLAGRKRRATGPATCRGARAEGAPKSATGSFIIDNVGPASLLDLINQSFEVMQTSLAQYKIAGYPPDVLINVPKRVCRFFEFYKAPELIALGREIARIRWTAMRGAPLGACAAETNRPHTRPVCHCITQ